MKVALYARVSTRKQTNENQMDKLISFAEARGYEYVQYQDVVSGKNKNRPALDYMTEAAKHHEFDRIIATKIDRLGRSVIHLNEFFNLMEKYGVIIEMTDQPIDTSTPIGKFTRNILGSVAELERELIRERTLDGLNRTRANGTKLGRSTKSLSVYHVDKIKCLLQENPDISNAELASHFEGISRNTLIKLAREAGLIK